uniref:Uncharacterized protein n=1 Tax=Sphaerodactylus townsendi TaxID=933632 RepID=A0ACB8FBA6_9SAUR
MLLRTHGFRFHVNARIIASDFGQLLGTPGHPTTPSPGSVPDDSLSTCPAALWKVAEAPDGFQPQTINPSQIKSK